MGAGEIAVGVGGVATVSANLLNTIGLGNIAGPGPAMTVGFAYTLAFRLVPSASMNDVGEVVLAVPSRPGTLTAMTTVGPTFDLVLNAIAPMVEPVLRPYATSTVQGLLDAAVAPMAASALGLPSVPPGVVLSLRRIVITPSGITFFPSMGAYGGLLPKINWLAVTDSAGTVVPEYSPAARRLGFHTAVLSAQPQQHHRGHRVRRQGRGRSDQFLHRRQHPAGHRAALHAAFRRPPLAADRGWPAARPAGDRQ